MDCTEAIHAQNKPQSSFHYFFSICYACYILIEDISYLTSTLGKNYRILNFFANLGSTLSGIFRETGSLSVLKKDL